jgi:hypothetical protein
MDFADNDTCHVYTIPIENIGKHDINMFVRIRSRCVVVQGDNDAIQRANQVKQFKDEPNEKMLQAQARRKRRLDGLQLFQTTKLNR